jgi:hypothetical protein
MIHINYAKHLIDELKKQGYRHKSWRRGACGSTVLVGRPIQRVKVVIKSIEVPPPSKQPLSTSVDDYFKKLQSLIAGIINSLGTADIFLPGGGVYTHSCMVSGLVHMQPD